MMPRMNGWDFRREQSKDIALRDIPVVVTTAEAFGDSQKREEFGKVGWLPKPFGLEALLTAIQSALARSKDADIHGDHNDECGKSFLRGPSS